jgi:predicted nucleic acid-binding protein
VIALFDTNIVIDALKGIVLADEEYARYESVHISLITWMEVMVGSDDDILCRNFLQDNFVIKPVDNLVAEEAVRLRRQRRIKLPDAIILASAKVSNAVLVTRNTRDFSDDDPAIRIPYML